MAKSSAHSNKEFLFLGRGEKGKSENRNPLLAKTYPKRKRLTRACFYKGEVGGRKKEQAGESVPGSVEQSGEEEVEQGGKITRQGEQV